MSHRKEGHNVLYTEDFKKQVVKKVLSPGTLQKDVCRKLNISQTSIRNWRKIYGTEMQKEIQEIDVAAILHEESVDIEDLLLKADYQDLKQANGSDALAQQIDQIKRTRKDVAQYSDADKYAVVMGLRSIPAEQQGMWLRQLGLQSQHIRLWEEKLITMSKKSIASDEYTKQLEIQVKQLQKLLSESERDNRELKILIELKKKYPRLFQQDEEKS